MKGLVFGKFMPPHQGHLALIDFAATQCDSLVVSMSYTPTDPIAPALRLGWLQRLLAQRPNIEVVMEADDFHDPILPIVEATRHWAAFIKRRFPDVGVFFCSEAYGEPLSQHLGIPCVLFDPDRRQVPISASMIREKPLRHWEMIPDVVRPYFVKKVCLYGPESVGKTTMAEALARHYNTAWVHETARDLLTDNDFSLDDIVAIGHRQTNLVLERTQTANKLLFCDTDVITTQIYSRHYLHEVPPVLYELEKQVRYDLFCLLDVDVPWVADGLRDLGHRRAEMFEVFRRELDIRQIEYLHVRGDWQARQVLIQQAIGEWF